MNKPMSQHIVEIRGMGAYDHFPHVVQMVQRVMS